MSSRVILLLLVSLMSTPLVAQNTTVLPNEAIGTPSILPGKRDQVMKEDRSVPKGPKRIWASSFLWAKAPELTVEEWLTQEPDMKGKYVLIELFNTWCTHCWTSIPNLNRWHAEYKDELVVIGLCDEPAEIVRAAKKEIKRDFYFAIDTQKRMRKALDVRGVPHAILVEPGGYVIWEGYPHLPDHELTDKTIEAALAVGRRQKADKRKQAQR